MTLNIKKRKSKKKNLSVLFICFHSVVLHSIYAFDHFNRYLLRTYCMTGIALGTMNSAVKKQSS